MRLWPRKQVYVDDLPRTHDIRFAALFVLIFVGILAAVYAVGFVVAGNRLPRATTVAGIDVGGMTRGEAVTRLQGELAPRIEAPITVHALGQTFTLDPQRSGLSFDIEKTVSNGLAGERWDPRHMWKVVTGGGPLAPVVVVDQQEMQATLDRIAAKVDNEPVDARVSFPGGAPTAFPAHEGSALDGTATAARIEAAFVAGDSEITVPVRPVDPAVTTTDAARFISGVARPAVGEPVTIRIANVSRTVAPRVFAPALRAEPVDGRLRLDVDPAVLAGRSHPILASLPHHPVNAKIVFRGGRPVVVPGRDGLTVEHADWATAVLAAASHHDGHRTVRAKVTPVPAPLSTEQARSLNVHHRIVSVQVKVAGSMVSTVRELAQRLDGALVRPHATFSLRARIGAPDANEGSVVASATYDAAFRGGMGSLVRIAPTTHLRGTEPGLDASLAPGVDLGWTNNTPYGVYIRSFVDSAKRGSGDLVVQLWSTPYLHISVNSSGRYDVVDPQVQHRTGPSCVARAGSPGFQVDVTRTLSGQGTAKSVERTSTRYAPVDRISCHTR